jgi:hypothetical protein
VLRDILDPPVQLVILVPPDKPLTPVLPVLLDTLDIQVLRDRLEKLDPPVLLDVQDPLVILVIQVQPAKHLIPALQVIRVGQVIPDQPEQHPIRVLLDLLDGEVPQATPVILAILVPLVPQVL